MWGKKNYVLTIGEIKQEKKLNKTINSKTKLNQIKLGTTRNILQK